MKDFSEEVYQAARRRIEHLARGDEEIESIALVLTWDLWCRKEPTGELRDPMGWVIHLAHLAVKQARAGQDLPGIKDGKGHWFQPRPLPPRPRSRTPFQTASLRDEVRWAYRQMTRDEKIAVKDRFQDESLTESARHFDNDYPKLRRVWRAIRGKFGSPAKGSKRTLPPRSRLGRCPVEAPV